MYMYSKVLPESKSVFILEISTFSKKSFSCSFDKLPSVSMK